MYSACGACADVPACVYGRASVPAAGRQYRHALALLLWLASKLHAPPQMSLPNPYHHEGAHPRRFME